MNTASPSSHKRSDRMVALLFELNLHGHLPLSSLAKELNASEATIRRDVAILASQRLLVRTHGGASSSPDLHELPKYLRDGLNQRAKWQIAVAAADMIPRGRHTIGFTGGSTATHVLHALAHRDGLSVITNSLSIGKEAAEQGCIRVLVVGGVLRAKSLELAGPLTEAVLRAVRMDTAIIGAAGVSLAGGVTTHNGFESRTNHAMIKRARRVMVVADASKIGRVTSSKMGDLSEIDVLITDADAPLDEVRRIRDAGVEVHVVPL